jgi:hypothetical protein
MALPDSASAREKATEAAVDKMFAHFPPGSPAAQ